MSLFIKNILKTRSVQQEYIRGHYSGARTAEVGDAGQKNLIPFPPHFPTQWSRRFVSKRSLKLSPSRVACVIAANDRLYLKHWWSEVYFSTSAKYPYFKKESKVNKTRSRTKGNPYTDLVSRERKCRGETEVRSKSLHPLIKLKNLV